jgi:plastocyanin
MKELALLFSLVFATGVVIAQETDATKGSVQPGVKAQKSKAEVVSFSPDTGQLTLKLESGETVTWTWRGPAAQVKNLKAGQKVSVMHKPMSGKESAVGISLQ